MGLTTAPKSAMIHSSTAPVGAEQKDRTLGKATTIKITDIPVSRRGRSVQLDTDMVSDLKKLASKRVQALNLAPYFEGKDLTDQKVRQAVGQNVRKNWTHPEGAGKPSKALRLDFGVKDGINIVAARLSAAGEAEGETPAEAEAEATV